MSLVGRALDLYLGRIDRWLRKAAADPAASQKRVFEQLLSQGRRTWFGLQHSFDSVRTFADYARAVPIRDYVADLEIFERIVASEADVAWPGAVKFFAQTSGTTAGDKRIPVTSEMIASNRRAALAIFAFYRRWRPGNVHRLLDGKLLFLGGSTALTPTPAGGHIGDLSGIATQSIFWPLSRHYEPGRDLALLDSWEEKVQAVARRVAGRDIRFVTGMPSWVKILFERVCGLRGVESAGGISRVWPHMQLFVHGGVNFAPYRPGFQDFFAPGHDLDFLEVYPASEGFVAIQARCGEPGMEVLLDNGLFYEFVPLSEWGSPTARRLTIGQVELDVPYSLVLTTNAGLWAYDIGDVVRFVSLDPPRVVFAGRNRHFINAYGENLIGEQVSAALAAAASATGAQVTEFTVAPRYASPAEHVPTHEWVVEFARLPQVGATAASRGQTGIAMPAAGTAAEAGLLAFAQAIDAELHRLNHDYSVKRAGGMAMRLPVVTPVPAGTFYEWMKRRGKLGGQHKVPLCANDRRYVDELLAR